MKRLLFVCTLFLTLACSAQVKISQMSTWSGSMDSAYVPIVVNLVNYKTLGKNFNKDRIDSIVNNWPVGGGSGIMSIEGNNGVTVLTDSIVQLGAPNNSSVPLTANRWLNTSTFTFTIRGSSANYPLLVENTGSSYAANFSSTAAAPIRAQRLPATVNDYVPTLELIRGGAGSASAGIGNNIDFYNWIDASNGSTYSGSAGMGWTNTTYATRTSEYSVTLVNGGSTINRLLLSGNGKIKASGYGDGTHTGTPTYYITSDVDGNFIEVAYSAPGGVSRFGVSGEDDAATANRAFSMGTSQTFTISGTYSTSGQMFLLSNSGTSSTFAATSSNGSVTGTFQNSSNGTALSAISTSGTGLTASTTSGSQAASLTTNPSSTNTTVNVLALRRNTSGTAANNIAGALTMDLEGASGNTLQANKLIWRWNNATEASRESSLLIEGLAAGTNQTIMELVGTGNIKLTVAGKGLALTSPDGTLWYITVSNAGVLSTSTSAP